MNAPIQGTAADIMKIAMNGVNRRLKENNMKSKLVLQVHDELLIEAYEEELEDVKEILSHEMVHAAKLHVPLEVDMHTGKTGTRQIMRIIGITGGVGSGKSQVLSFMKERYGAVICQADQVAWKLQEPGSVCYEKIVAHFGTDILRTDRTINREILGGIVFGNAEEMAVLNGIVHPEVKAHIKEKIATEKNMGTSCFVLEAALLLEDHYDEICHELWYIYTEESVRRIRLKESRGYSDEKISAMIASQMPENVFRQKCQVVINNSNSFEMTQREIEKAMNRQEKRK